MCYDPVKCVMIPTDRILLVVELSSPKLGPVTGQLMLCSHRNRLLPRSETDHPQKDRITRLTRLNHTGPLSGLTSVTRLPSKRTHRSRMIPGIWIDHSRRERMRPTSHARWCQTIPRLEISRPRPIPIAREKPNHTGSSLVRMWQPVNLRNACTGTS